MHSFGACTRYFNYILIENINYYLIPKPLTKLFHKTVLQQEQLAASFFTMNTSS